MMWVPLLTTLALGLGIFLMSATHSAVDLSRVDRLPIPPDQKRRTKNLVRGLSPLVQGPVLTLLERAAAEGAPIALSDGRRDLERQKAYWLLRQAGLWALPAARPSTRAWHFLGRAVDVTAIINGRPTRWREVPAEHWTKIGNVGKALGFVWGGDWPAAYDPVHFEWRHRTSDATSPNLSPEQAAVAAGHINDISPDDIPPHTVADAKRLAGIA